MTENPELLLARVMNLVKTIKSPPPPYSVVIVVDGVLRLNNADSPELQGRYVCSVTPKDINQGFSQYTAATIVKRLSMMQRAGLLKS